MKKITAIILIFASIIIIIAGGISLYNKNKTTYVAEGFFELKNGELHFFFDGQEFVWELGAGDKIPNVPQVRLIMEGNGTSEYSDDKILSYWER